MIDNASSAAQVKPLLPSDGSSVGIVTSRNLLDVGARVHRVAPLDAIPAVDVLRAVLEVSLGAPDERIDEELASAYELARICGYLPLALRICAAMLVDTPRRPVSSLVKSLQEGSNLIDRLSREEEGVRAVFDLSFERLTETQKTLLGFISFTPGFDISTAAAARLIEVTADAAEELLIEMSRAHLVEQGAEWGRWRLHDLVRRYALEAVADLPGQEDALMRVLTYYTDHSRHASLALGGDLSSELFSSRDAALSWFDTEYENLISGVNLTAEHEGLRWFAVEVPHRLARYLDARRLYSEWRDMMTISLRLLQGESNQEFEANAMNSLGMAYRELHEIEEAVRFHREAISIARQIDDDEMLARYLNNAGNALLEAHDLRGAFEAHSESATLYLTLRDNLGFARATDNAASALRELGRPSEALVMHQEAIAKFREFGAHGSEAVSLTLLGSTLHDLGRYGEAVEAHRKSVQLLLAQGRSGDASKALNNLSNALRGIGDIEASAAACRESLKLCSLNEDRFGEAQALNQLGLLYTDEGKFTQAIDSFEEGIRILSGFEGLILSACMWANLGRTYGMMGDVRAAIEKFSKASALFSRLNAAGDAYAVQQIIDALSSGLAGEDFNEGD
ncbi:tetratricopeptide repeat protein [Streptomyces sp. NPDC058872]|uniref:tetratricopeptide repeat protein n=1 Tax=Streptomyces sp. NPDC058872 TaxID=3346661 RepID=UPI0036B641F5